MKSSFRDGKIEAIGLDSDVQSRYGDSDIENIIDAGGKTVIPGELILNYFDYYNFHIAHMFEIYFFLECQLKEVTLDWNIQHVRPDYMYKQQMYMIT